MKPILSLLIILLLGSCSYQPSTARAVEIGNTVKKCCTSLSMAKSSISQNAGTTNEAVPSTENKSVSILERGLQLLTW
ncbi:MAG: hypothetical protein M0Q26_05525 [Chitinophagaceae bacterium]|nr:hypothetical protein [Chitinophagaceae bacterium]MDP1764031.1 hypothetical protein [Sediminibacterium sp.]MDP1811941.1 hypothetical protein [Sediminibacterium sp.]MDP3128407.1 hypothetical protein [Sediminibacterium sp.]MDP3665531.1 hypothetical protein [Sediminibacterium sp.]